MNEELYEDDAARKRRRKRIEEARRQKQKQKMIRKLIRRIVLIIAIIIIFIFIFFIGKKLFSKEQKEIQNKEQTQIQTEIQTEIQTIKGMETAQESANNLLEENSLTDEKTPSNTVKESKTYTASATEETKQIADDVLSTNAILINMDSGEIIAQRDAKVRVNPASMTKILTVLVAAEANPNLEDKVTITREITDYSYTNDCSNVGFDEGEVVTVRDLFYGTILPSGADAAAALAIYTSGSIEAFVEKMNQKIEELGLSQTAHFTNPVGLYEENHYCSVYDMAMIMQATIDNPLCKEVLSARTYTTSKTTQHPDGLLISNWFLRRIEDKDSGGEVIAAKTGYVLQSGSCAASYAKDAKGNQYICVSVNAHSSWRCIYDHVALYKRFLEP